MKYIAAIFFFLFANFFFATPVHAVNCSPSGEGWPCVPPGTAMPDITVDTISCPSAPNADGSWSFSGVVKNIGNASTTEARSYYSFSDADGKFKILMSIGTAIQTINSKIESSDPLAPGETKNVAWTILSIPQDRAYFFSINSDGSPNPNGEYSVTSTGWIYDSNENNDIKICPIPRFTPTPTLTPAGSGVSTPTPAATAPAPTTPGFCGLGETELGKFASKFFGCGLSLVGGVALLFIIYGGFMLMTSSGDFARIKKGKEYIAFSVIGLLLAIFTMLLLQVVGGNLLNIPGFGS